MTPKFMRAEAARFRDMASTTDREASRLRLLAMADDYEARARAGEDPATAEAAAPEPAAPEAAAPEPAAPEPVAAPVETTTRLRLSRRPPKEVRDAV
jgi:hypothetical protein